MSLDFIVNDFLFYEWFYFVFSSSSSLFQYSSHSRINVNKHTFVLKGNIWAADVKWISISASLFSLLLSTLLKYMTLICFDWLLMDIFHIGITRNFFAKKQKIFFIVFRCCCCCFPFQKHTHIIYQTHLKTVLLWIILSHCIRCLDFIRVFFFPNQLSMSNGKKL